MAKYTQADQDRHERALNRIKWFGRIACAAMIVAPIIGGILGYMQRS